MMRFTNALLFTENRGFVRGDFEVENGVFTEVHYLPRHGRTAYSREDSVDLQGQLVLPGLVDIHVHGAAGADFSDADPEGLIRMAVYLAAHGITTFAPTSMTLPYSQLHKAFGTAAALRRDLPSGCAEPAGIHMEGPFFSNNKKGAQNSSCLQLPDSRAFKELYEGCGGLIRIADIAPELPGAINFIKEVKKITCGNTRVSVAHTDADYEQACAAFQTGASHLTHLYNAMPTLHHRAPGVIGAAAERENVTAELICDGHHVHPSAVRAALKLFPGRICLVSDALRCCGLEDGTYELGGQPVFCQGGVAKLQDGALAGSVTNLFECMRRAIAYGVPVREAVTAATLRPAQVIGCDKKAGSIEAGKKADFLICGKDLQLRQVCLRGEFLHSI